MVMIIKDDNDKDDDKDTDKKTDLELDTLSSKNKLIFIVFIEIEDDSVNV